MKAKLYAAEINLNFVSPELQHRTDFNDTQVRAYLGGLSTCYSEVLILNYRQHVLVLAMGTSSSLLVHSLRSLMEDPSMIMITEETKASTDLLLKVMKGERWKEAGLADVRYSLELAMTRAAESDCLGTHLQYVIEQAFDANYLSTRPYTWQDRRLAVLKYPTVTHFDFNQCSLN